MLRRYVMSAVVLFSLLPSASPAQTVQPLAFPPPGGSQLAFLLTDGSVMVQTLDAGRWVKLTPDINGSYVNGTWSKLRSLPVGYAPTAFASALLADGRLIIEGGEYNYSFFSLTNKGAIYDPVADRWTMVAPPTGWGYIGDSPSVVLPDGKFLLGDKLHRWIAELDPSTLSWTQFLSAGKNDFNAEEGWTLLPDGSVLTVDVKDSPKTERYVPSRQSWLSAGSTPEDLVTRFYGLKIKYGNGLIYHPPGETGPALLRPDGTVFATGSQPNASNFNSYTAIYTPPSRLYPSGRWVSGPVIPNDDLASDTFASLLPNGHVLLEGGSGELYEFDGTNFIDTKVNAGFASILLLLPTGDVLICTILACETYTSTGTYQAAWQPTITSYPATVARGFTYQIAGTQFNGLSQANAFGDELENPTNYPLVRITNQATGHVFYARTHDHSTMGVATGSRTVSTNFDAPVSMDIGTSSLVVVANGIPSQPVSITVR